MNFQSKLFLLITDIIFVAASFFLGLLIRFEGHLPLNFIEGRALFYLGSILIIILVFYLFGLYRKVWRYAGVYELVTIFNAVSVSTSLPALIVFITGGTIYPRSAVIIAWFCNIFLIGGVRFILRLISEYSMRPRISAKKRALIVGANDTGEIILRELQRHASLGYAVLGFIDEDINKKNIRIHGVPVLGPKIELPYLIEHLKIDEIIITLPTPSLVQEIVKMSENLKVKLKIIPSISEIIDGRVSLSNIREVQIEDLLEREVVNFKTIVSYLKGKRVLVTGAGGSIGREICRQIIKYEPDTLILLGRGENSIYELEIELRPKINFPLKVFIGDIRDLTRMKAFFREFKPEVVFHAAAHKHVYLMEENISEAITNNVFGTLNLVKLAKEYQVENFVFLSTDKAVNPISIMGASKRLAEMILQNEAKNSQTKFISVRFGNVLDSRGSVIPTFRSQISKGGPVTLTHPEMTRFFMTIPEAVQLVIQAGGIGKGGEIFVLDMGKPIKILDLAKNMIKLSGFEEKDILIKIIGIRQGEKIKEELLNLGEEWGKTEVEKILKLKDKQEDFSYLELNLEELKLLVNTEAEKAIISKLKKLVSNYKTDF